MASGYCFGGSALPLRPYNADSACRAGVKNSLVSHTPPLGLRFAEACRLRSSSLEGMGRAPSGAIRSTQINCSVRAFLEDAFGHVHEVGGVINTLDCMWGEVSTALML